MDWISISERGEGDEERANILDDKEEEESSECWNKMDLFHSASTRRSV